MSEQGPGEQGGNIRNLAEFRRSRAEAAAGKKLANASPDSFVLDPSMMEAVRSMNFDIASRALDDMHAPLTIDESRTFDAFADNMSPDQLAVAVSEYKDNPIEFRTYHGDAKAYAIMNRARVVFSR